MRYRLAPDGPEFVVHVVSSLTTGHPKRHAAGYAWEVPGAHNHCASLLRAAPLDRLAH